jgi:hypothetical protein
MTDRKGEQRTHPKWGVCTATGVTYTGGDKRTYVVTEDKTMSVRIFAEEEWDNLTQPKRRGFRY